MKHPAKEPSSNGDRKAPRHGQRWADAGAGLGVCDCAGPKLNVPSLLEALGNPAAVISLEYQILATNQAYRDTFNSGDPVSGRRCYEISHNLAVPCCEAGGRCPLRQAAESGERARAIHLHHTCRGEEQEMVSIHPLFDADHQLISCLEILSPARLAKVRPREGQGLVGHGLAGEQLVGELAAEAGGGFGLEAVDGAEEAAEGFVAVEDALGLDSDALSTSRAVLGELGNMSSPTVLFVLERTMRDARPGDIGVMVALGPGLAAETALLRW